MAAELSRIVRYACNAVETLLRAPKTDDRLHIVQADNLCCDRLQRRDHAQIFGWVCYETAPSHTIHYVYTKHPYREMGVANSLLINAYDAKISEFGVTQVTHETKMLKFLQTNFEMLYNPFFLWEIYANVKAGEN